MEALSAPVLLSFVHMDHLPLLVVLLLLATCTCSPTVCTHGHPGPSPAPPSRPLPSRRPPKSARTFESPAVDAGLAALAERSWKDPELLTLLTNCLPNTLDTTVWHAPDKSDPTSFISTGDIAAMWLRDSSNQVMPYMRYAKTEPEVRPARYLIATCSGPWLRCGIVENESPYTCSLRTTRSWCPGVLVSNSNICDC